MNSNMTSNRISKLISNDTLGIIDCIDNPNNRVHRVRNPSCSASSTMSSTSSSSSSTNVANNLNENCLIDVLVVFPNGFQIAKQLDTRKAIYDILIELSATAKLLPTNYTLKLFSKDENINTNSNNNNKNDCDLYKLIEYTPNQTIGQLNPARINILPKTATLKHQQHQLLTAPSLNTEAYQKSNSHSSTSTSLSLNNKSNSNQKQTPFELTTRVEVNLPFNQKTAVRVKADIILDDLFDCICKEAGLERNKYELVVVSDILNQNSGHEISMQDQFALYNTKEVTLVLKRNSTIEKSKNLNSKSTHSIFSQNILKSRTQPKNYQNNKSNKQVDDKNLKIKSKSELDLSVISQENNTSTINKNNKNNFKDSTTTLTKTNNSMFSFFTRKKNSDKSKSKQSLNNTDSCDNAKKSVTLRHDDSYSIKSIITNKSDDQSFYQSKYKKRQAPAPPTLSTQNSSTVNQNLKTVLEQNEIHNSRNALKSVVNIHSSNEFKDEKSSQKTRSKSEVFERNFHIEELDKDSLEKLISLTKKKKKTAPLPPQAVPKPASKDEIDTNLSSEVQKLEKDALNVITNLSPKSFNSNDNQSNIDVSHLNYQNHNDKKETISRTVSSSSPSYPSPSLSDASSSNDSNLCSSNSDNRLTNQIHQYQQTPNNINNSLIIAAHTNNENETNRNYMNDATKLGLDIKRKLSIQSSSSEIDDSVVNNSLNSANLRLDKTGKCKINDTESVNDNSMTSSNNTEKMSRNSSIATVDDISKSFANAISVGEKYLIKSENVIRQNQILRMESSLKQENKNINDDSLILTNVNCVKSFYGAVIDHKMYSEDDLSDMDSTKTFNSPAVISPLINNQNYLVQNLPNQKTKIVIKKQITPEAYDHNNNQNKNNDEEEEEEEEEEASFKLKLDTRIPNVLVEATENDLNYTIENLNEELSEITKKMESNRQEYFDESAYEITINPIKEPIKQTAIIEIRPEFETSSLITVSNEDDSNKNVYRHNEKNSFITSEKNKRTTLPLVLRSPSSPPPQFPAIGANEINETHANYTVVRSGDIIEKNGIYYSNDGTIRGYSGIVKKLANSKALNEVFQKQQEIEQQHERDYELELQKKLQEQKTKENIAQVINSNKQVQFPVSQNRPRASLGNIVANEKKNSNLNLSATHTLSSGSNIFKLNTLKKNNQSDVNSPYKPSLDDELSKKLENRRQTIANQLAQTKPIEIDTSLKPIIYSSNSSSNQSSSSSCTSPSVNDSSSSLASPQSQSSSNIFMNQKLKSNNQNQKMTSPSFVMSAKVRSEPNSNFSFTSATIKTSNQDSIHQNRNSLINELKSLVPIINTNDPNNSIIPPPPSINGLINTPSKNLNKPEVAPKNFNHDTLLNLNKKNQIINARDDLLESIKGFSISNLKKVNREQS